MLCPLLLTATSAKFCEVARIVNDTPEFDDTATPEFGDVTAIKSPPADIETVSAAGSDRRLH